MEKYLMFGFMPIRVSTEGTWTADVSERPAGEGFRNATANFMAGQVLGFVHILETVFHVVIPIKMTQVKDPKGPRPICRVATCSNPLNCELI